MIFILLHDRLARFLELTGDGLQPVPVRLPLDLDRGEHVASVLQWWGRRLLRSAPTSAY